jgi:hypothetical protein
MNIWFALTASSPTDEGAWKMNDINPTIVPYEPPISTHPFPLRATDETTQLAPGVRGYTFKRGDFIFIPLIMAESEGSGDVGRFLDRLPSHCLIMDVTSERLEGMLKRRGWSEMKAFGDDFWIRR